MKKIVLSSPILTILPTIALIPVLGGVLSGMHDGGLPVLSQFFTASLHPSLEPTVLQSAFKGLQITIATALLSWTISTFGGLFLGLFSSNIFWNSFKLSKRIPIFIRRFLAVPRSIHELIWGLLLLQIFGINPWVAILAICIPYSCLVARVFSDQIDNLDPSALIAIRQSGSGPIAALTTSLLPPIIPVINSYCGYRLECALRGATILGLFGLGGIGTELNLTLQSLEFQEMWTSLWMLGVVMFSLETILTWWRRNPSSPHQSERNFLISIAIMLATVGISLIWLKSLDINLLSSFKWHSINLPTLTEIKNAFYELPWINLIWSTTVMTLLAAGISIGTPALSMMLWPTRTGGVIQSCVWSLLRLIPAPLSALLLLLCTSPNISVAALALGLHNLGVMGRFLKEGISHQSNNIYIALRTAGSGNRMAWLYGQLSLQSTSYLAYSAYRTDVLMRETAVVGVVGGVGLGWQLQESLSSFNWAQVFLVTATYSTLTLIGESMSESSREFWFKPLENIPNHSLKPGS